MLPRSPWLRPRRPLRSIAVFSITFPLVACNDDPTSVPVTSGTLGGVPFTVVSGEVLQGSPDGPLRADALGAEILLDQTPAALGMSNPNRLHLLTLVALQHGGTLTMGAFGNAPAPFGSGTAVVVGRNGNAIDYAFYLDSAVFADSTFSPGPSMASEEHWIATEFYADSVPGYGAGSGITMWGLNDVDPALGDDVLGCTDGPAMSPTPLTGNRVAYRLTSGFLLAIQVVDTIVGPCV